jgi:hypothetical protein
MLTVNRGDAELHEENRKLRAEVRRLRDEVRMLRECLRLVSVDSPYGEAVEGVLRGPRVA